MGRDVTDASVEVVTGALEGRSRLAAFAAAGWDYGRRWTDPVAQAALRVHALRARLD